MSEYFVSVQVNGVPDLSAISGALDHLELMAAPDGSVTTYGFAGFVAAESAQRFIAGAAPSRSFENAAGRFSCWDTPLPGVELVRREPIPGVNLN